jgi:hypothetical protein
VRLALSLVCVVGVACQKQEGAPTPAEITERAWDAHALAIAAGERAKTCAEAGAAMQKVFTAHRQTFVDAVALDRDKARLAAATAYIEANERRYADLETRMEALSERCPDEPTVQAAFEQMANP